MKEKWTLHEVADATGEISHIQRGKTPATIKVV